MSDPDTADDMRQNLTDEISAYTTLSISLGDVLVEYSEIVVSGEINANGGESISCLVDENGLCVDVNFINGEYAKQNREFEASISDSNSESDNGKGTLKRNSSVIITMLFIFNYIIC